LLKIIPEQGALWLIPVILVTGGKDQEDCSSKLTLVNSS
jgi:hypothetical protein